MMANEENIRKWIDALRSGEFQQTRERLADTEGYCCLGVACEVAMRNGVDVAKETSEFEGKRWFVYNSENGALPTSVADWLGLIDEGGRSLADPDLEAPDGRKFKASGWNDEIGANFDRIADLIEFTYLHGDDE